jgi:hypothetical protein
MSERISITLSEHTAEQVREMASLSQRNIEDVIAEMINSLFLSDDELEEQLATVSQLADQYLWALVDRDLPIARKARLDDLTARVKASQPLSDEEQREYQLMLNLVEVYMLWRSSALAELKQRGYKVGHYINQADE